MNQGKLEAVKQEMARVNIDVLGISELKRTRIGEFDSDDHYIYYWGQESLRRNGVAPIVNERVWNAVLRHNLKNDRMISVRFQGKPFNITVIQAYGQTSNAEKAEVEWFNEDFLELTPKKDVLFITGEWNAKVGSQEIPGITGDFDLGVQNKARQRLRVLSRECTGHSKHPLPLTQEMTPNMDIMMVNIEIRLIIFFPAEDGETLYSHQKQDWELTMAQIMKSLFPNSDLNWRK